MLARSPFTRKSAQNLLTKKVVPCFIYGMLNPIMTVIRKAMWRIAGAAVMVATNWLLNKIQSGINRFLTFLQQKFLSIISSILTWGGIIALALDFLDGSTAKT